MTGKPDDENLAFAAVRGRVIYSANVGDYASLHREWLQSDRGHAGIIVCNDQRWSVGEQLRRIIAVADAKSAEQMVNNLEHLSNFGTEFDR